MANRFDKDEEREALRLEEVKRLRNFEQEAVRSGTKLGPRDRLKAAFHLTRAWNTANRAGLLKSDFQDGVLDRLRRPHRKRQEFRLTNWTLRRGEDPFQQDLMDEYEKKTTPQKALEPYLVAITVAAQHCNKDPDDWKLDMMRNLSIWTRPAAQPDVAPGDDRASETLAILLRALCETLARKNRLGATFDAIRNMSCRWEMFEERLVPDKYYANSMEMIDSPISPVCEESLYFEEMFPFPSVPLVYVPYLVGPVKFALAPEDLLRSEDAQRMADGDYSSVGAGIVGNHYNVPEDAPGLRLETGKLIWSRELRLCLVPDGHGSFAPSIESRPRVEVEFDEDAPFPGRQHVSGGYEPSLERGLFYARADDGGHVWPHIRDKDGLAWRLRLAEEYENGLTLRDPDNMGWYFDPDPVRKPGAWSSEPWYLSYTQATAPYLRHWLTGDGRLAGELGKCPWDRSNFDADIWNRRLPPIHELNFPDFSFATWIECCLHNGLIEEALQASIDRLKEQVAGLQSEWHQARERHSNALLKRWNSEARNGETKS